jgi:hypothetical protein
VDMLQRIEYKFDYTRSRVAIGRVLVDRADIGLRGVDLGELTSTQLPEGVSGI